MTNVEFTDADADTIAPPPGTPGLFVDRETRDARLDICRGCDRLFRPTYTCKECGCFMAAKTWLGEPVRCPLAKW